MAKQGAVAGGGGRAVQVEKGSASRTAESCFRIIAPFAIRPTRAANGAAPSSIASSPTARRAASHSTADRLSRCTGAALLAHKIRNLLAKVRVADQAAAKTDLQAVINAKTVPQTRSAARRFAARRQQDYRNRLL
jgi:hypothetical protein